MMQLANDTLSRHEYNAFLDNTNKFLLYQQNVVGYVSWGSNDYHDTTNGMPYNDWGNSAIAETFVSTSARSFT